MISKKAKYGVKAVIFLARQKNKGRAILISEIARAEQIPKKFLELILLELKNKGILESYRGKTGGYMLAKEPKQISLGDILRTLEGPIAPLPCLSKTAYRKCDECKDEKTCSIKTVFEKVYDALTTAFDGTTLDDMVKRADEALELEQKVLMYHI